MAAFPPDHHRSYDDAGTVYVLKPRHRWPDHLEDGTVSDLYLEPELGGTTPP